MIVDEVVAVHSGLHASPSAGYRRRPALKIASVQHPAGGHVVGMPVGPVRHRHRPRPGRRTQRDTARVIGCRADRAIGQPQVDPPRRAKHPGAASASASRSSTVPLLPISPAVRSHSPTRWPSATCLATVPPIRFQCRRGAARRRADPLVRSSTHFTASPADQRRSAVVSRVSEAAERQKSAARRAVPRAIASSSEIGIPAPNRFP